MSAGYQVSVRRKSKMASVELRPLTVKVKSPDPRDSTNDQKSLPRADLLRQIPRLHPASPPPRLNIDRCIMANADWWEIVQLSTHHTLDATFYMAYFGVEMVAFKE